jgi:hypothetical protein
MVFLGQKLLVFENQSLDSTKIMRRDSPIAGQSYRLKPEFALFASGTYMHVRRLARLIGIKVKSEWPDTEDSRHRKLTSFEYPGG